VPGGTRHADAGGVCTTAGVLTRQQGLNPMSSLQQYNTPESCSVVGTFGELQVTAYREHVLVEVQSRNYDTVGHLHCEHALARLPLQKALQLRGLLDRAIEASRVTFATSQPGLWSNSAVASVAGKFWRRRRA
jgi:hypothetical protein